MLGCVNVSGVRETRKQSGRAIFLKIQDIPLHVRPHDHHIMKYQWRRHTTNAQQQQQENGSSMVLSATKILRE
jgi:hypothetical protein